MFVVGVLFFVFGFLTWVNGILIPYFKICMQLTNFQATLVAFSSYLAYFIMAIPSALVLENIGYRKGMVSGLCVMSIGTLTFIPAAYSRFYILFLGGLFLTASGLALVQTAANPYIAIMGPLESTAKRIGLMGIANKIAGIISLILLGKVFLADADELMLTIKGLDNIGKSVALDSYALKIVNPYLIITAILLFVALMVHYSKIPEIGQKDAKAEISKKIQAKGKKLIEYPNLVLGVFALFVSGACETIPIDGIIIYSQSLEIPMNIARHFGTYTLFIMLLGYLIVSILVPKYTSQKNVLLYASIWGLLVTVLTYYTDGIYSIYALLSLGFSASMLWGTIWGLSLRGLGKQTKKASAILIMSLIGGGIFPLLFGDLIDQFPERPQSAILILLPCYAYIFYYSVNGYKIDRWKPLNKANGVN